MVRPFVSVIPEVSKPERKVMTNLVIQIITIVLCADTIQRESAMDSNNIIHLFSLLSNPSVWDNV